MNESSSAERRSHRYFFGLAVVCILFAIIGGCMMRMPGRSHRGPLPPLSAPEALMSERLRGDVTLLAGEIGERTVVRHHKLTQAASFIGATFAGLRLPVREDAYRVEDKAVINVEAEIKGATRPEEIVVVGAHYDSPPGSPGANDNASGVAGVLELARMLHGMKPARTVRFVAFVNEEPPWFQTDSMGSLIYARRAAERNEKIVAMLSLETIGYYSDTPKSQQYPFPFNLFYPDTGNFIAFVANLDSRELLHRSIKTFRETTPFPSEGVAALESIQGIGWSDHWSFWQAGYPAFMVTDTAPFRYPHYHQREDTPEKLDYDRMARVVTGIGKVVEDLAR